MIQVHEFQTKASQHSMRTHYPNTLKQKPHTKQPSFFKILNSYVSHSRIIDSTKPFTCLFSCVLGGETAKNKIEIIMKLR